MKSRDVIGSACGLAAAAAVLLLRRPTPYPLRDKVVVITGGSRGLGLALAREFGRQGAKLALIARDEKELERAASDLHNLGAQATTWPCDLQRTEEIERVISGIASKFGRINVLVNNAGIMLVAPLELQEREDFEETMALHFWAPYHVIRAALPYLRQNPESRIVNISSIGGRVAVPHMAAYCASKFALAGFSDAIRPELAKQGVYVTTVSPGLMRTGSHVNANFKGDYRKEFAWFSLGAGMPFFSIDANRAAHQIVAATRRGSPELTITLQARALVLAQALFPGCLARIFSLLNSFLPKAPAEQGLAKQTGYQSQSVVSPSPLTALADRATAKFNETPEE
jgi:NAD(P)-dependent dehydrogenase (short-subunit alcohol dehydrogenase family)